MLIRGNVCNCFVSRDAEEFHEESRKEGSHEWESQVLGWFWAWKGRCRFTVFIRILDPNSRKLEQQERCRCASGMLRVGKGREANFAARPLPILFSVSCSIFQFSGAGRTAARGVEPSIIAHSRKFARGRLQ